MSVVIVVVVHEMFSLDVRTIAMYGKYTPMGVRQPIAVNILWRQLLHLPLNAKNR